MFVDNNNNPVTIPQKRLSEDKQLTQPKNNLPRPENPYSPIENTSKPKFFLFRPYYAFKEKMGNILFKVFGIPKSYADPYRHQKLERNEVLNLVDTMARSVSNDLQKFAELNFGSDDALSEVHQFHYSLTSGIQSLSDLVVIAKNHQLPKEDIERIQKIKTFYQDNFNDLKIVARCNRTKLLKLHEVLQGNEKERVKKSLVNLKIIQLPPKQSLLRKIWERVKKFFCGTGNADELNLNPLKDPPRLHNIGNSCYMDGALHLLWRSKEFLEEKLVLALQRKKGESATDYKNRTQLPRALEKFYEAAETGRYKDIQASIHKMRKVLFSKNLGEFQKGFEGEQQDAEPFLTFVLNELNSSVKISITRTDSNDEDNVSVHTQPDTMLRILFPENSDKRVSLQTLFDEEFAEKTVNDPLNINDTPVEQHQDKISIHLGENEAPPEYIFIHLKRYQYTFENGVLNTFRVSTPVHFDNPELTLNLSSAFEPAVRDQYDLNYELVGVENQSGSLKGGHYTSDIKNPTTGIWTHCDDCGGRVEEVLNYQPPENNVYLMVFKRKILRQKE